MSKSFRIFRTYSGGTIIPKRTLRVIVMYKNENFVLILYILPGNNVPIIGDYGRDWLMQLGILKVNSKSINLQINVCDAYLLKDILQKYKNVFANNVEKCKTYKLSLILKETKPIFYEPRPVPFAM